MIGEILSQHTWLGTLAWQSSLCLVAGLGGSFILRRWPARAHQVLLITLIATAAVPTLHTVVKERDWGLFVKKTPPVASAQTEPLAAADVAIPPDTGPVGELEYTAWTSVGQSHVDRTEPAGESHPMRWLFSAWALAGGILLGRLVVRFFLGVRLARQAHPAELECVTDLLATARLRLGITGDVAIRASERVHSPMIWCWARRPVLLISSSAGRNRHRLDWTSIICHELAHWRRRDHLSGLFIELLLCVLPWQPLLWLARRRLVSLSEQACDDWVLACGRSGEDYAETLLDLTPRGQLAFAPSVVSSRKPLVRRVRRILQNSCGNPRPGLRWTIAALALAICTALGVAFAQTRPAPPKPQAPNAPAQTATDANEARILLRLIDPNGEPVREAKAGAYVRVREVSVLGSRLDWLAGATSDETGQVVLKTEDLFRGQRDQAALYILHEERRLGAVHQVSRTEPGDSSPIVLKPVCRVHGTLASTDLAAIGMPLRWAHIYVYSDDNHLIEHPFDESKFDFELLLPPGEYTLNPYGSGSKEDGQAVITASTKSEEILIAVSEQQHDLDLGAIDLGATKLATMIGYPAPEIGPMKAWKNGSAVTLGQLRGQVVWLHFSGGYPSASRDLPRLVELHKAFGDKGLTVIAIYNCASVAELEQRWAEANARFGGAQEVPFRVAVDGGEPTFFERTGRERPGATYGRYDITAHPTDVLIDAEGNIIGESHASRAMQVISQMLGMPQEPTNHPVNEDRTQASLVAGQTRTLRFPQDRSLGTLHVRDAGQESWYKGWEDEGEAKGNRSIAAGRQVKLEVNEQAAADLSPLAELDADDLQMLCFGWEAVPVGSLAAIGKLTGLRALNLQSATFDSDELRHLTSLRHLEVLRLGGQNLTDSSMQYVGQLASLRSLALWSTGINDEGLRHLQGLTQLTFLALNGCEITDDGLRYLHGMTALEGLQLPRTKISDAGLVHLAHLTRLTHINIGYDRITDAGLKHLEKLPQLENIWLNNNPITDEGFRSLAKMRNLKELYASDTKITDQGLAHLAGLPDLHHIITDGIGDEGLAYLSTLPSLASLQIHDAKVTEASIPSLNAMASLEQLLLSGDVVDDRLLDALRAALPQCKVYDPQRSREYPMPEWRRRFEAVYRLEEGEVLRRIAPPFIPERMDYYREEHELQAEAIPRGPDRMTFHWDRKLKNWGMAFGSGIGTLSRVLGGVLRLKSYEYDGPKPLLDLELPGDWIIRDSAAQEAKLRALETLIEAELGRRVRFEKGIVERDVIVATGSFRFHPPVGTYENTSVHLYAGDSDKDEGAGGGTADSVGAFLQMLGDRVNMPVIDRTEPGDEMRIPYRHHRSSRVARVEDEQERARTLRILLDNLTAQTELQFEVRRQPVEVWHITTDNTN